MKINKIREFALEVGFQPNTPSYEYFLGLSRALTHEVNRQPLDPFYTPEMVLPMLVLV